MNAPEAPAVRTSLASIGSSAAALVALANGWGRRAAAKIAARLLWLASLPRLALALRLARVSTAVSPLRRETRLPAPAMRRALAAVLRPLAPPARGGSPAPT